MMRGLLDEVEEDPTQVDRAVEPEQRVRRSAPALVAKAGNSRLGAARTMSSVRCACCQYASMTSAPVTSVTEPELLVSGRKLPPR